MHLSTHTLCKKTSITQALARELKASAIAGVWDNVRDLLVHRAGALVVTQSVLESSGVGKVVGKLRKSPDAAVVFAAEEVIEGWKFQISLETTKKPAVTPTPGAAGSRASSSSVLVVPEHRDDDGSFVAGVPVGQHGAASPSRRKSHSHKVGEAGADALGGLDQVVEAELARPLDDDDDDDGELSEEEEEFVAVPTLLQCEAMAEKIKALTAAKKWRKLHTLLRHRVARLLVTEDDLRRSGIGRVLAKVVKRADTDDCADVSVTSICVTTHRKLPSAFVITEPLFTPPTRTLGLFVF